MEILWTKGCGFELHYRYQEHLYFSSLGTWAFVHVIKDKFCMLKTPSCKWHGYLTAGQNLSEADCTQYMINFPWLYDGIKLKCCWTWCLMPFNTPTALLMSNDRIVNFLYAGCSIIYKCEWSAAVTYTQLGLQLLHTDGRSVQELWTRRSCQLYGKTRYNIIVELTLLFILNTLNGTLW